ALIVAPLFIRGSAPFGVITQSAMAFSQLLGAFSLIVTQFQSISAFAAVTARLSALAEGIELTRATAAGSPGGDAPAGVAARASGIAIRNDESRIAYEALTLQVPPDGRVAVRALSLSIPVGTRTLIVAPDQAATHALVSATA